MRRIAEIGIVHTTGVPARPEAGDTERPHYESARWKGELLFRPERRFGNHASPAVG